ncbi:hypothetical protein H5410_006267 [Solanum commersonii]|uniref:Uncharacterized protein n=1 Tax=Solanum commersonii TaxID=4109 RepID=A0A9J6A988_SOLCO|nr:hypothetical protein H5410_006267 [Solanum commersonii]
MTLAAAALLSLDLPKLNVIKALGSSITFVPETLEEKFGLKGIKFSDAGTVELTVRNGSSVKLQYPMHMSLLISLKFIGKMMALRKFFTPFLLPEVA